MSLPIRLAIFASGSGTNAVSLIQNKLENQTVAFVLSDQPTALVLNKAKDLGISIYAVEKTTTKENHEHEILEILKREKIDWICLAGYMRILSSNFLNEWARHHNGNGQVVNIHPSKLPAYPGIDSIARAYADGVSSGVTLHYVDAGVDTGEIIFQEDVELVEGEEFSDFKNRVHQTEYALYKLFLKDLASERIKTNFFKDV